jgi:replication factor C large subunit
MKLKTLPFAEKYRAKYLKDIKGQDLAIQQAINFIKTFPRKKALILSGPVGIGKTSIAIALSRDLNLEMFELNASDLRNRTKLDEILKPATLQKSLFNSGKLILMDEADGITATDYGGLPELLALIDKTNYPIIITANDIWNKKFNLLRKKCQMVNLHQLREEDITQILKQVIEKEGLTIKPETIKLIARKSNGDARASLNDIQAILNMGESDFVLEIGERERQENIFNALKTVFQEITNEKVISIYDNIDIELDEIILWVEENIPLEYKGSALAKAYDWLSKADLFKGRIYKQQYWRFLVYQSFFLSAGISSVTKLKSSRFIKYQKPSRVLKIWLANQKYVKKRSITVKYARFAHMSKKKAMKESFLLPLILNKMMMDRLDLDDSEKEYLKERKQIMIEESKPKAKSN